MPDITPDRASQILLVDDQPQNLDILLEYLAESDLQIRVATQGEDALELMHQERPDLVLLDVMMPGLNGFEVCERIQADPQLRQVPVIFMSALSDVQSRVKGFQVGGVDYVSKPLYREEVLARIQAQLTIVHQQRQLETRNQELERINRDLSAQIQLRQQVEDQRDRSDAALTALSHQEAKRWGIDAFIGQSHQVLALLNQVRDLQQAQSTNVLVLGESGTGKELISRAIHYGSGRNKRPLIAVNCSAIPAELADAEFFGHTKGAFTGASQERRGYFEQADGGTLFLDEIGDMPLTLQIKLLRVLEDGLVTPIGSSKPRKVNVRIVAATNVDMQQKVADKTFRQDLYFRLAGYVLQLPPLRERPADIPLLVEHFISELSVQMGRPNAGINEDALALLTQHSYPGNVRELKNLIEFSLIASRQSEIQPEQVRAAIQPFDKRVGTSPASLNPDFVASQIPTNSKSSYVELEAQPASASQEQQLLDSLTRLGKLDNTSAQEVLGVDHNRASYLLKKLHKEGKLIKQGERRWTVYTLAEHLGD